MDESKSQRMITDMVFGARKRRWDERDRRLGIRIEPSADIHRDDDFDKLTDVDEEYWR